MSMINKARSLISKQNSQSAGNVDVRHGVLLYVEGLTVSFDGFKALNDLNLYVDDGELRCLIGANGAGKTTLMDVITGKTRPDLGSVYFGQTHNLLEMATPDIMNLGSNLELSLKTDKGVWSTLTANLSDDEYDRIHEVLKIVGLSEQVNMLAGALSHGQKQWLEIGMLLAAEPRLLLIDEPVAGMTAYEVEKTAELLISLEGKHTVIVVEHDMEFVRSIARKVTVLHQGSVLMEGDMDQVQNDKAVREVYLGSEA